MANQPHELFAAVDGGTVRPAPAERVRLREAAGLTEASIAQALGARVPSIQAWEAGRAEPKGERLDAYRRLLEGLAQRYPAPAAPDDSTPDALSQPTLVQSPILPAGSDVTLLRRTRVRREPPIVRPRDALACTPSATGHGTVGGMNADHRNVLDRARVATRLPAQDLDRARRFYSEQLGLEPVDERPGGLLYRCGGVEFAVFLSTGVSPGSFTQMAWQVDDIEAVVSELGRRGVVFEELDLPGLRTKDGIAEIEGNYPSKGARGERGAWFRDSEGNMLGIGEPVVRGERTRSSP